ncbi:MAG: FadR family transcriptional regulator [Roseiflexaceae bacterium]|nr:FadR family transcriptional regulator [Roseiflexaceae bacterium]
MPKYDDGLPFRVSQQLLRRIMRKEFPPGTVLPSEREIGETYSVSRPVAREAIKLLAARGLVTVHPRQGATVGHDLTGAAGEALLLAFHQADAVQADLLHLRLLLEPQVAGLAASHATFAQQRRMSIIRQHLQTLHAALDADDFERAHALWPQTDQPLHVLLGEMCQNAVFKVFVEIINTILWTNTQEVIPEMSKENLRIASNHHLAICDAVLIGDSEAAHAAMVSHLEYTRDHIFSRHNQLHELIQIVIDA